MAHLTGLLQAIEKDDKKAFDAFNPCGKFRLGRFPVLSLLYLYNSKCILSAYENEFLKITSWEAEDEPAKVSRDFSAVAGKCLRLYINEIVTPLEMLLILDKTRAFKKAYPAVKPSKEVCGRLQSIYSIKYSLGIKFEGDGAILDKRPMTRREKKTVITAVSCSVLAAVIAVGVPVTAISLLPKPVEGEVDKLSQIDFNAKKSYTLKNDLTLPENFSVDKVNCTIYGGGHTLTVQKGCSLGELTGSVFDVTVQSQGALFTAVAETGSIKNAAFNVTADISATAGTALVAQYNYGLIENVTLNVGGRISALATGEEVTRELLFGGIVLINNYKYNSRTAGTVKNCTVNYSQFSLEGRVHANALYGGVVGANGGYVENCVVTGEITSTTFDIAGVCASNTGRLTGNINNAHLAQVSPEPEWNPMTCGIVLNNMGTVENCKNEGSISATSTSTEEIDGERSVIAGGIAYSNGGEITGCVNAGSLSASGQGVAVVGGIVSQSYGLTENCISRGDITVQSTRAFVGGIMGSSIVQYDFYAHYFGVASSCISENRITVAVTGEKASCVGGIAGLIQQGGLSSGTETVYIGGGVTDSYFVGENTFTGNYSGAIAGIVGAEIYEKNSYTSGGNEYHNFENNCFLSGSAFGAAVSGEDEFNAVEDKGATVSTLEGIKNSDGYKNILKAVED